MKKSTRSSGTASKTDPATSFHGKVALITGATQGIGLALARSLAEEGCSLILCARDRKRLAAAESELGLKQIPVQAFSCDVADEKSVASMFAAMRKKVSHLDILINSAGIAHALRSISELKTQEWNQVLATNLTGTFLVSRAALSLMSRGSSIVNILSMSSKRAFPNLAAYTASKFGALGLTHALREELRSQGIRVIAALPGSTDTAIWDTLWPEAPRNKMMRAETVAQAIVAALKLPPETTVEELELMPTGGPL
ncbi:MAG TPA: SDR family NAD(P)-dependent oxidoreductase [Terriglobales bacterium]|jgi:NAD(P)-dependent dehydrogenase (short-subunit alcohol dehydrogenase family)|nr:SDR family NAD(P)-dependent oxidoreductase [Terriglobales bacterium]